MRIAYHLGAHCTDEGAMLRVLLRNRALLLGQGIAVPEPDRYPVLLRAAAAAFAGRPVSATAAEELLDALLPNEAEDSADQLVLSFEGFLAFPRDAVTAEQFYPNAGPRARGLAALFPQGEVEFLLALRNPATFLPALSARRRAKGQEALANGFDASALRWSELVQRLQATCPDARLTVWCDEDTPLIWHSVLRATAGHPEALELPHALELPASLMTPEGARQLAEWLASSQPTTDLARRKGIAAQLAQHALPEKLEVEVDLPGWGAETVARLSADYDADCAVIRTLPGVTFLAP